jgi:RNA polymerase sigma-70 factor (ECF subfamily)
MELFGRPGHYLCVEDDAALLRRARAGDEAALSELFARHCRPIFRYAMHMGGREVADDVVQETFLAVLQQRERLDAPRHEVIAYLLGIARHLVLKRLRAKGEEVLDDHAELLPSDAPSPLDDLTRAERIAAVRAAIAALPAVYREVVVLCDLQELDYASAARVMQCPLGTIRSRLARARALLLRKVSEGSQWANTQPAKTR